MSPPDGGTLLDYMQRICEAAERIADYLTGPQQTTEPDLTVEAGGKSKRRYYGQESPQPESSHAEAKRPKQASRS